MASELTAEQLARNACHRAAYVLKGEFEDNQRSHSRVLDVVVQRRYTFAGTSVRGGGYSEHVVPCAYLRDLACAYYDEGRSVDDVAEMLFRLLKVVDITKEEQFKLNQELGLRTKMPVGWDHENGSPYARLDEAGIKFDEHTYSSVTRPVRNEFLGKRL